MPWKSKKTKLLELLEADTEFSLQTCELSEVDFHIDNFVEDVEEVLTRRYFGPRSIVPKSQEWFTKVLPELDDLRFKRQLRVSREQFTMLIGLVQADPVFEKTGKCQLPLEEQLAIALYRFGHAGNGASYVNVASKFGVSDGGVIMNATKRIMKAVLQLKNTFVTWPDASERRNLKAVLHANLPGCIGFLDGTHVNLNQQPSVEHPDDYFSRKHRYGLCLQVVCDVNLKIRQYCVGRTARSHDAYVYNECDLAINPGNYFAADEWLGADAAYKLTPTVITPFRRIRGDAETPSKRLFNKAFSPFRVKVEHCYGILKKKFASLQDLRVCISDNTSHRIACEWIETCVVLHNILLTDEDERNLDLNSEGNDADEEDDRPYDIEDTASGETRRQELLELLLQRSN